jgi:hypothetical protein
MTRLPGVLALVALIALLASPPLPAQAKSPSWTRGDWQLAGLATSAIAADCITTNQALRRGARELNPFLGERPGTTSLTIGCVLATGATVAIADALPRKWRKRVFVGVAVLGFGMAVWNTQQHGRLRPSL